MCTRHLLLCLLLFAGVCRGQTNPIYLLTRVSLPEAESSRAVALNDSGTLLGVATQPDGSRPFLWRPGAVTFLNTPGKEAIPYALNNHDEVVGSVLDVNIYRPWLYSNGVSSILGPQPGVREDDAARAINDDGVVVGNIGSIGYLLSPKAGAFPQIGGGPCWTGAARLLGIDNSGAVLGTSDGASIRWPSFQNVSEYEYLPINAVAIHGSNVVGNLKGAPALLRGTNLISLSAPANAGTVLAINDAGLMVGEASGSRAALIWNGPLAVELGTLVQLPEGARLISPVAINQRGQIAATLLSERTTTAVLLTPSTNAVMKAVAIEMPPKTLFKTPSIELPVHFDSPADVSEVSFLTYRLSIIPASGPVPCGWIPPHTEWTAVATNLVRNSPFSLFHTNLPPGQYAFQAAVRDRAGTVTYSFPGYFVVAGRPAVRIQKSWWNNLEVALDGTPGYIEGLEVSSDLVRWRPLTNEPPAGGLLHQEMSSEWQNFPARYYRAKVIAEDVDSWGYSPLFTPPPFIPEHLTYIRLQLNYDNGDSSLVNFSTAADGLWDDNFSFTYEWYPGVLRIELVGEDWRSKIAFDPPSAPPYLPGLGGPPWPGWGSGRFREDLTVGGSTTTTTGAYHTY